MVARLAVTALQVAGLVFAGLTGALKPQDVTPLTFYRYWYWYRAHPAWQSYVYGSGAAGVLALLMPVAVVVAPGRRQRLHGEARWARRGQIRAAGLLGTDGIVVGKLGGRFLDVQRQRTGQERPRRRRAWLRQDAGSDDPELPQLARQLGRTRHQGRELRADGGLPGRDGAGRLQSSHFLSRDDRTHQYNPFAYVSGDKNFRVGDIEKIAHYLLPNPPGPGSDPLGN